MPLSFSFLSPFQPLMPLRRWFSHYADYFD
jgi:hypothetical protein